MLTICCQKTNARSVPKKIPAGNVPIISGIQGKKLLKMMAHAVVSTLQPYPAATKCTLYLIDYAL